MFKEENNPFNITKATDFNDQQINDFWVDISADTSFSSLIKPTSPMPMLVLGGKGSGKTHLMRYFSYSLQKIRNKNDVLAGINKDGYIGIYMRCGGLNSGRFNGGGYSLQAWSSIFEYYMELWLSRILLNTVCDAIGAPEKYHFSEETLVSKIIKIFNVDIKLTSLTIMGILSFLEESQKGIDNIINNCALSCNLNDAKITVNRGSLLFGIPRILSEIIEDFSDCLFVYLIDEFENLLEYQQKYFNTLIREKEIPATFKIGSRLYGIKTYSTFSADEENKDGSEYETLWIDDRLRRNPSYNEFARRMIAKRLVTAGFYRDHSNPDIINLLDEFFETKKSTRFEENLLDFFKAKNLKERKHFKDFIRKYNFSFPENEFVCEEIVKKIECSDYPILEKQNLFLIYRAWAKNKDLLEASKIIKKKCEKFIGDRGSTTEYSEIFAHFKKDFLDQLLRENGKSPPYYGLTVFIDMSWGLPKNLLILLKNIFSWAVFLGEKPFVEGKISIEAQEKGVIDSSDWFFRDAKKSGKDGLSAQESIRKLGTLLEKIRYSDKPSECSITAFSAHIHSASANAQRIIDVVKNWSLLIDVSKRFDRNTSERIPRIQINKMLAPKWGLPLSRRGEITLRVDEINAIFDPTYSHQFNEILNKRVEGLNAPWNTDSTTDKKQILLFQEVDND